MFQGGEVRAMAHVLFNDDMTTAPPRALMTGHQPPSVGVKFYRGEEYCILVVTSSLDLDELLSQLID